MARRLVYNREGWEAAIGKFVLAFNDIEHDVALLFHVLPECRLPKTSKTWTLAAKLTALQEILSGLNDDRRQGLIPLLDKVKALSVDRNRIAHGPMRWEGRNAPGGQGVLLEGVIAGGRTGNQRISYDDVVQLAVDADILATELGDSVLPLLKGGEDDE